MSTLHAISDGLASLLTNEALRLWIACVLFGAGGAVVQVLGSMRQAIREEADSQKAVAIDAGMDQAQLTRKLHHQERFTFDDLDRMPVPVQQAFHLAELIRLDLPKRMARMVAVAGAVQQKRSA